jgi:ribosomal protein L37AE/L43A
MNTSFNYKKKNRKTQKNTNTLDYLHNKKIELINNNKKNVKNYKKELEDVQKKYNNICSKKNLTETELDEKFNLYDQINNLKTSIQFIEDNKEEEQYLLDVGNILFEYYDNDNSYDVTPNNNTINLNNINNKNDINDTTKPATGSLLNYFDKKCVVNNVSSKGQLLDDYLNIIDNTYESKKNKIVEENICSKCNNKININYMEGISICIHCGEQYNILIDSDKPNYKEPTYESNYFAYKRINHFNEWLSQFQAKESTDISSEIIEKILLELKKERILNVANISNSKIREILKKLKLNKFYEHIPYIINKINGKPPPTITKEMEEKLRFMFKEIQGPFELHCPKNRKNFLSYSYVIHKFIQLLNMDEYLIHFPLLKSREKLYQQDKIWKNICKELNWEFINSI